MSSVCLLRKSQSGYKATAGCWMFIAYIWIRQAVRSRSGLLISNIGSHWDQICHVTWMVAFTLRTSGHSWWSLENMSSTTRHWTHNKASEEGSPPWHKACSDAESVEATPSPGWAPSCWTGKTYVAEAGHRMQKRRLPTIWYTERCLGIVPLITQAHVTKEGDPGRTSHNQSGCDSGPGGDCWTLNSACTYTYTLNSTFERWTFTTSCRKCDDHQPVSTDLQLRFK